MRVTAMAVGDGGSLVEDLVGNVGWAVAAGVVLLSGCGLQQRRQHRG
jgi:hypothetical protein